MIGINQVIGLEAEATWAVLQGPCGFRISFRDIFRRFLLGARGRTTICLGQLRKMCGDGTLKLFLARSEFFDLSGRVLAIPVGVRLDSAAIDGGVSSAAEAKTDAFLDNAFEQTAHDVAIGKATMPVLGKG